MAGTKISDVKKTDKVAPSPTSRPIIVTDRPTMASDPMVTAADEQPSSAPPVVANPVTRTSKVIKPLTMTSAEDTAEAEPTADDSTTPAERTTESAATSEAPAAEPEPETTSDTDTAAEPENSLPSRDTEAQVAAEAEKVDAAKLAREAELEKLIESGRYALPVNAMARKRSRLQLLWLCLLAVALAVALLDVLLDAGTVKLGSVPHTHFFAGKAVAPAVSVSEPATVATKTYVSATDKLAFTYPVTWKLLGPDGPNESIEVVPPTNSATGSAINFTRPTITGNLLKYNVEYVHYQPFTSGKHKLFVRQLVSSHTYSTGKMTYEAQADVTDTQGQENVGDSITDTTASFMTNNGVPTNFFVYSDGSGSGTGYADYSGLNDAKAFFGSPTYKSAQKILTSIKF